MGGDGRIMDRLWSFASSYMPSNASDYTGYSTASASLQNTPRRQQTNLPNRQQTTPSRQQVTPSRQQTTPSRWVASGSLDGPGERWERSIERWDNSPKVVRDSAKKSAAVTTPHYTVTSATSGVYCATTKDQLEDPTHGRSDSGSSSASCGGMDLQTSSAATSKSISTNLKEDEMDETIECIIIENVKDDSKNAQRKLNLDSCEENQPASNIVDHTLDSVNIGQTSQSQSEISLGDIAEEEQPNQVGSAITRNFFSRNAPERLSSLFKRGVGGADEKLRGFLKKSVSRSSSKDSMGSVSSTGSIASSPSSEKLASVTNSENDITPVNNSIKSAGRPVSDSSPVTGSSQSHLVGQRKISNPVDNKQQRHQKKTNPPGISISLVQSSTDQKLFNMKGEQPRLFQSNTPEDFKTPPTSPAKKNLINNATNSNKLALIAPIIIPVSQGRDKVILGDPLGALDSPTNSPQNSPPRSTFNYVPEESSQEKSFYDDQSTLVNSNVARTRSESVSDFTVPCETISDLEMESSSVIKMNDPLNSLKPELNLKVSTLKATRLSPLPSQMSPEETPLSLDTKAKDVMANENPNFKPVSSADKVSYIIAPMGSPFSPPVLIPTTPRRRSSEQPKTLPPFAPKTPNRTAASVTRQSRSANKSCNRRVSNQRSSSANTSAASDDQDLMIADDVLVQTARRGSGHFGIQRNSSSLTSLATATEIGGIVDCNGISRRRGSDLAPRQAATLESNYSPASPRQQNWIRYNAK